MDRQTKIVNEFIKRKIVTNGTPVYAVVTANGIGGQPVRVVKRVVLGSLEKDRAKGWTRDDAGKDHVYNVAYSSIKAIEGMDVERMAKAYKLKI
jgi:hypothetical protein